MAWDIYIDQFDQYYDPDYYEYCGYANCPTHGKWRDIATYEDYPQCGPIEN